MANLFLEKTAVETPEASKPDVPRTHTLLMVDDEPKVLSSLQRVFRQESYRLLTATSAAEALDIMQGESVEVILCDHRMPGMTGAELLTTIRSRWPETIRIMLTGYADVQSIMGAVNEGAVYKFMTKPWQDDDLRITVARALEQYDLQQEVRSLRAENRINEERIEEFASLFSQESGLILKILLREQLITAEQRDTILHDQEHAGGLTYEAVLRNTKLTEDKIAKTLETALGVEPLDLREVRISPEAASLIPPAFCRDNLLVPVRIDNNTFTIAMADPTDILKRENLQSLLGLRLNVVVSTKHEVLQKINEAYGQQNEPEDQALDVMDEIDIVIEESEQSEDVEGLLSSSTVPPVVRIVNAILAEAVRRGASDIHIEPRVKGTVVRYRIDGLLQDRMELPAHLHAGVTSRIKILAKMDIAEKRRPQDGRITVRAPERMVDLRVSSLPTLHGENVVLRVLDRGGMVRRIKDLGLSEENLARVRAIGRKPQGIIVCTGPTGSGKTTMLYALLREHLTPESSYGTIEDPVEYYIEQASQVLVREKVGLTFPLALRSMLRQDPDVILVGEIRDHETAQIAFQAALTGHLVLSTLHTNNAVASITRLVNLGVERYLIASGLECVMAQRLLRAVCPRCSRQVTPDPQALRLLNIPEQSMPKTVRGAGCDSCNQTGYVGRLGVFEVLELSDRFREIVLSGGRESELADVAREEGMKSLFEDAIEKVVEGRTTLEEVLRVLGPRSRHGRACPGCGQVLELTYKICPDCGCVVRHTCPECGERVEADWTYCASCGKTCQLEAKTTSAAQVELHKQGAAQ